MDIKISDLKDVCDILCKYLDNLVGKPVVRIPHDRYWDIQYPERYDEANANPPIYGPKLSRDWTTLEGILKNPHNATPLALVSLSALLRAIGDDPNGVVSRSPTTTKKLGARVPK
jgi:hypothetical protein